MKKEESSTVATYNWVKRRDAGDRCLMRGKEEEVNEFFYCRVFRKGEKRELVLETNVLRESAGLQGRLGGVSK